jgi:hypothetical protein
MLAQGVFEASQLPLRISAHPAIRITRAQKSPIWKFPIVPGHPAPVCPKVHTISTGAHFQNLWLAKPPVENRPVEENRIPLLIVFSALSLLSVSAVSAVVFDSSNFRNFLPRSLLCSNRTPPDAC